MFRRAESIVNQCTQLWLTGHRRLARLVAATLFPPRCCLCGFAGKSPDLDLCEICHEDLPWDHASGRALTALRFEYPVDDLIRRLKYQGTIANARVLGGLLAEAVRKRGDPPPRLLVPVPLHAARFRERGFNQSAAIARYAGRLLEIPTAHRALRRVRDTPSQTALDVADRHRNVRDAFALAGPRQEQRLLAAEHVALVDDVLTTGSTLQELRGVLLAAGVRQVDLWAVARAP